jgi:hypothetical protein
MNQSRKKRDIQNRCDSLEKDRNSTKSSIGSPHGRHDTLLSSLLHNPFEEPLGAMKIALALSLVASTAAFAPSQNAARKTVQVDAAIDDLKVK